MKNKIEDLRNHLFATIEGLLDPDKPMDLERAQAVANTAQVIVNSAKVEVDYLKATGKWQGTGFIEEAKDEQKKLQAAQAGIKPKLLDKGKAAA